MTRKANNRVALLIDTENIWISLQRSNGCKADFALILEKAAEQGALSLANAYADFTRLPQEASLDLFRLGIRQVHTPRWGNGSLEGKSSADEIMADDAYRLLRETNPPLTFVLATGDGHFIPLVSSIRRQGKKVVIMAVPEKTSHLLLRAAGIFVSCLPEESQCISS